MPRFQSENIQNLSPMTAMVGVKVLKEIAGRLLEN